MKDLLFQKVTVTIRDLSSDGDGIGSYEGFTLFVPKALIGEVVEVKVKKIKKNYGIAKVIRWIKTSNERNSPKCPYFGRCGGCQIMHLDYEAQINVKATRIQEALKRIGLVEIDCEIRVQKSPKEFYYRNKVQLPFCMDGGRLSYSLYAKGSHENVPIKSCFIHNELGEKILPGILDVLAKHRLTPYQSGAEHSILKHLLVKTAVNSEELLIVLITHSKPLKILEDVAEDVMKIDSKIKGVIHHENTRSDNVILGDKFTTLSGDNYIQEKLCDFYYNISAPSFFQVNPFQAENLYQKATEIGELSKQDVVIDAYCGIGALSLFLAKHAKKVIGLEYVSRAIEDAKQNAAINQITNTEFFAGDVIDLFPKIENGDVIYLNPPRKGCEKPVLDQVVSIGPKKIIYISCDPMTLARDAKILCENGYKLDYAEGFDMFPQTMHVETLARFIRKV